MSLSSNQIPGIFRVQADLKLLKGGSFLTKYDFTVHSGFAVDTTGPEEGIICWGFYDLRTALKWLYYLIMTICAKVN